MADVVALVDGFNMYGALNTNVRGKQPFAKYKWINYWELMTQFLRPGETLKAVYLFTAYPKDGMHDWRAKRTRHVLLVDVQRDFGVAVKLGRFARRERQCLVPASAGGCGKILTRHEEKKTDVNIAVTLVSLAYEKAYNTAFLVTADGDLIPAVDQVKLCFPGGRIVNIPPIGRSWDARYLIPSVDDQLEMEEKHLRRAVLPQTLTLSNGRTVQCPIEWQ